MAYGADKRITLPNGRVLTASRVLLHCTALRMPCVGGGELSLELKAPLDMQTVWRSSGGEPALLTPERGAGT